MAYIILTCKEIKTTKIVFKNLPIETARTVAAHMNKLSETSAKRMGEAVRFIYKVVGK